jgi:hypothetical protein
MEYKYEALDAQGNEVEDTIKAYDKRAAIDAIRKKGLFPTLVRVIGNGVESKKKSRTIPDWLICRTTKEKAMFSIICLLLILIAGLLSGCSDNAPTKSPTFQNFDLVKITLSGKKAQVINNRVEFDRSRGCWLVQVKMEKQSMVGRMARKMLGRHEVKDGWGNLTIYEAELEPWDKK